MTASGKPALSVHDRIHTTIDKFMAYISETHVEPTSFPLWYVYAGHNLMKTFETREAAETYMQTGGTRYVATILCQHEMGPASAVQSA